MRKPNGLLIDEALDAAGSRGLYQKLIFALSFAAGVPNPFVSLNFVFSQYEPEHHCTYPKEFLNYTTKNESTRNDIISTIIPVESGRSGELVRSGCKMYMRNYSVFPVEKWPNVYGHTNGTQIVDCMFGIDYKKGEGKKTAAMEFSMVCNEDWKAPLAVSLCHAGLFIGSLLGVTADRWGRRPIFICGCILQVIAQLLGVLAWNFSSYCAFIFIGSICQFMVCITSFVMATEITDYGMRNFMGIATFYAYSTGYCIVALVGYLFQQWRWMLGFLMVLTALIYIPCCFLFPESPRWLAQKGESERAIELLRTIAKVNGRKENFENKLRMGGNHVVEKTDIPSTGTMDTLKVLFKSGIGGRFLAAVFGWSVTSMVYYAIAIYSTDFSSDRFINFFLAGVSEIPAFLMTFLLLKYIGRPRTNFALLLVSGFSSFVLPFIPKDLQLLSTVIALAGKISIAGVFYAWFLIACEMIPTLQRSSGVGICSAGARIGSFLAPYLMYTRKYNYFAPNIVMGISAVLSAWAGIFFVPETLGVEIPDTAEEAKQNRRFYGLKLGRKFLREKNADSNIKKTTNDIEERELML